MLKKKSYWNENRYLGMFLVNLSENRYMQIVDYIRHAYNVCIVEDNVT